MAAKYELDLRDYLRILKKRRYTIIFSAIMMGVFSYIFARMQEPLPIYQASASVKIEKATSMPGLYMESMSMGTGDNLETQATIIRSYPIMEIVAKEIGKLDPNLTSAEIRQNNDLLDVVLNLKNQVETEREGFTNIINIIVTSGDSKFSQKLANTVAEIYKRENTRERNKRSDDAVKFIGKQLKVVKARLTQAEEDLKKFRKENELISLDAQSSITLNQVTATEADLEAKISLIKELREMVRALESEKAISEENMESGIFADGTTVQFKHLNTKLVNFNVELDTLLLVYTEKHPQVMELKEQVRKIRDSMLKELYAHLKTLEERKKKAEEVLSKLQIEFKDLPQSGLALARLERDVQLQAEVYSLLEEKYQESLIRQAEKIEEVVIVRPALEPNMPINPPSTGTTAVIGIILGATLGLIFSFISETLDTSIGTIEDVEEFIGVSVIGIIPFVSEDEVKEILLKKGEVDQDDEVLGRNARLVSHFAPHSTLAESYRTLRTNIQFSALQKDAKVLLSTSSSPQEGKTTTNSNLAMTMAQIGLRTLLIDADMRKPMVNKIFGLDREPGLSDILLGNYEIDEAVRTVTDIMMGKMGMEDIMKTPGIDNLSIITSGAIPPNPSELLNSPRMKEFIEVVKQNYDVVIFDATPILPATDAAILGSQVDAVILVYKAGAIARGALKRAKVQMDNVSANVLGVVLNALKSETSSDFQDYKYGSYYAYGGEADEVAQTFPEKIRDFAETAQEKFEEYTGDMKSRLTILGVSLFFMLAGLLLGEWQLSSVKYESPAMESSLEDEPVIMAGGDMGPENMPSPDGGTTPGEGPSAESGPGLPGQEGGPISGPVDAVDAPSQGISAFSIFIAIAFFAAGMFYAIRWYRSQDEEDEDEEYEDEDEDEEGEEKDEEEKEKDPYGGIKHVKLSLDMPDEEASPEDGAMVTTPSFELPPADFSSDSPSFELPSLDIDQETESGAMSGFSIPDLEEPSHELPGMDSEPSAAEEEGHLPDFKFAIPGMEEPAPAETPEPELPAPDISATEAEDHAPPPEEDTDDLPPPAAETLIDSSYKGFDKVERFGELDGEELPDFSDFDKLDFSDGEEEQASPLEDIKAVPHPEGGALESFPEEGDKREDEAPTADYPVEEKPVPEDASEEVKTPESSRAITWDTTPLEQVDTPMHGLSAFSDESEAPEEETASSSVDFKVELPSMDFESLPEEPASLSIGSEGTGPVETTDKELITPVVEPIPTEETLDDALPVEGEIPEGLEAVEGDGVAEFAEPEIIEEGDLVEGELAVEEVVEGDFVEKGVVLEGESEFVPEELPVEGEVLEGLETVEEDEVAEFAEPEIIEEGDVVEGELAVEEVMEGDFVEEGVVLEGESEFVSDELPVEGEVLEGLETVEEDEVVEFAEPEIIEEGDLVEGELAVEEVMEGDFVEEEVVLEGEPEFVSEELPVEGEVLEGLESDFPEETAEEIPVSEEPTVQAIPPVREKETSFEDMDTPLQTKWVESEENQAMDEIELVSLEDDIVSSRAASSVAKEERPAEKKQPGQESDALYEETLPAPRDKKDEKSEREEIEKRIEREMMSEREDVNRLLGEWKATQKEELNARFRKKTSINHLVSRVGDPEKKRGYMEKFKFGGPVPEINDYEEENLIRANHVAYLYKKYKETQKGLKGSHSELFKRDSRDSGESGKDNQKLWEDLLQIGDDE